MATANFEIGNKEFEVRFIPESGYPPTKNERGSSLIEYDVTTYKDNQPMMKKFNQKKRVYFDLEGNVYKSKQSNKVWFNLYKASFFSHIKEDDGRYVTTCCTWKFCIPYIGNESLVGTTKDVEG